MSDLDPGVAEATAPVDTSAEGAESAQPTAAELAEEMFDLTVNGQVEKVSKTELMRLASHGKGAARAMSKANEEKQAALRLTELLKLDPIRAAKELRPDFDERDFLTKRLAELMEDDMLSPQERTARSELAELKQLREEKRLAAERIEQEELDKLTQTRMGELDVEIAEAMKTSGLPKSRSSVRRLATYMLEAEEAGLQVPVAKLASQVKEDMKQELLELLNQSDDDAFEAMLGSELLSKAQKVSLKKLKTPGVKVDPAIKIKPKDGEEPRRKTKEEALKELGYENILF